MKELIRRSPKTELTLHPLLNKLPAPDVQAKQWESFVDNMHAAGPERIDPILINGNNQILSGSRRWRAAKQLGWPEIVCVEVEDYPALTFIESLLAQRDITRGAKLYLIQEMLPQYAKEAESRRLANLKQGRKTFEPNMPFAKISPVDCAAKDDPSNSDSQGNPLQPELPKTIKEFCRLLGVSDDTWAQARKVRALFAVEPKIKEIYEPQLLDGRKNLWNVISGAAGEIATKEKPRPVNSGNQLELFTELASPFARALAPWNEIKAAQREDILAYWRRQVVVIPQECRKALAEILLEAE